MRLAVIVVAALSFCGSARGAYIEHDRLDAGYWTATDTIEFRAWFTEPPNIVTDQIFFGGIWPANGSTTFDWFLVTSYSNAGEQLGDLHLLHIVTETYRRELVNGQWVNVPDANGLSSRNILNEDRGPVEYVLDGSYLTVAFPFAQVGVDHRLPFTFGASVRNSKNEFAVSGVDELTTVTPEPSSAVLCLLGVVGVLAHRLFRRPRLGLRLLERHVGHE